MQSQKQQQMKKKKTQHLSVIPVICDWQQKQPAIA